MLHIAYTVVCRKFFNCLFSLFNVDGDHHLHNLGSENWKTFPYSEIQETFTESHFSLRSHVSFHNVGLTTLYFCFNCMLISICRIEVTDQCLTLLIELFYEELGREKVFKIWWCFHLFFLINVYITANVYILFDSRELFPDLASGRIDISFVKIYRNAIPLHQTNVVNTTVETIESMRPEQEKQEGNQELFKKRHILVRQTTTVSKTLDIELQELD